MPKDAAGNDVKLSYEELMEQLKDPSILHAAAAKHGLKVVSPENKREEKKGLELPKFEIPEDADQATLVKSLNEGFKQLFQFVGQAVKESHSEVRQELVKSKEQETAEKIQKFAKEHEDFKELIPFIEPYFNAGRSIEEAYELGKRASGKAAEGTPNKNKETPPRQASTSENVDIDESKEVKPKSVREAAKKNLDKLLADMPADDDVLDEKDDI